MPESRTTRDGFVRTSSRTIDAIRPLVDGVKNLEQRTDRFVAAVEKRRADQADQRLRALFDGVTERIYSASEYRVSETFKRRLETIFGKASKND